MSTRKTNYVKGQLNCAETIIDVYNKNTGSDIPVALGSGLGTGMTVGSVCGAINASAIIIGAVKGRCSAAEPNEARAIVNTLMKRVKEVYGTELCVELLKNGVSCSDLVEFVYLELEKILQENR